MNPLRWVTFVTLDVCRGLLVSAEARYHKPMAGWALIATQQLISLCISLYFVAGLESLVTTKNDSDQAVSKTAKHPKQRTGLVAFTRYCLPRLFKTALPAATAFSCSKLCTTAALTRIDASTVKLFSLMVLPVTAALSYILGLKARGAGGARDGEKRTDITSALAGLPRRTVIFLVSCMSSSQSSSSKSKDGGFLGFSFGRRLKHLRRIAATPDATGISLETARALAIATLTLSAVAFAAARFELEALSEKALASGATTSGVSASTQNTLVGLSLCLLQVLFNSFGGIAGQGYLENNAEYGT